MFSPDLIEKNYYQLLMIGHYLDVRTADNQWRMALITDRDNKYLTINFQSYDHKEQHVFASSFRVAPLRMYTEGFHNQYFRKVSNQVLIPFSELQKHLQMMKKKYLHISDPSTETAFQLTQYLRGQLFVTMYYLLFNQKQLKAQQLVSVVLFLEGFIDFIGDVCQNCLKYASQYFQNPPLKQLYLVNPKIALIYSLQELLIIFNFLIKAQSNKYVNIFRYNQEINYEKLLKRALQKKKIDKKITDLFMLNDNNGRWLPFGVRKQCLRFILKYIPNWKFPKYTKKDYAQYMQIYPIMMSLRPQKNYEWQYIVYLVQTLVQLSPFEGKLRALQQLRKMLQKDAKLEYFQPINIIDLLSQKGVLEYMLNPQNFKPEIFKRLVPILNFYCKVKNLTQKQISSLFKLAASGHESEMTTIYEIITQITQIAPFQSLDQIFTDICQLDINNEQTLTFIKNFTIKAIKSHSKTQSFFKSIFGTKSKSDKYDYYGLNLFWKQTQDNGKIVEKHIPFTLDLIRQIFNEEIFHGERQLYLTNCLNCLEKNKNFGQSIKIMTGIISSYPSATYISEGRKQVVEKLDKKYELLQIIMKGIKFYPKMKYPKVNLKDTLKYFFAFLEQYSQFLKYPMKIDYIEYLWSLPDNSLLLEYIRKNKDLKDTENSQAYKLKYMKKIPIDLLKDILSRVSTKKFFSTQQSLSESQIVAIDDIFLSYHFTIDYLNISERGTIRYINPNYIGVEFYINALKKKLTPKLYEFVLTRLIDINLRPKSQKVQERIQTWQNTFMLLLNLFKKEPAKCLEALRIFLTLIEGKKVRQNVNMQGNIDIVVSDGQVQKTISLAKNSTIYTLRKLIEKIYNIKGDFLMYNVEMKKEVTFIEEEDYSVNAMSYSKKGPSIILKNIKSQLHQLQASLKQFKDNISNQDVIYNTIFSFLNTNKQLHKQVWQIMQLLPTNKSIINKLKKCDKYTDKDWQAFVFSKGDQQLLYSLNIMKDLMKKDSLWTLTMCETGGYDVIYKLLLKNLKDSNNLLQIQILCTIILECLQKNKKDLQIESINELILQLSKCLKKLYNGNEKEKPLKLINVILSLLMWSTKFAKCSLEEFLQKDQFFFTMLEGGLFQKKDQYSSTFNQQIMPNLVLTNFKNQEKKFSLLNKLIKQYLNLGFLKEKTTLENYFVFLIDVLHSLNKQEQSKFFKDQVFGTIINQFVSSVLKGEFIDPSKTCFNDFNFGALKLINFQISTNIPTIENLSEELCQNFLFNVEKKRLKHEKCKRLIYQILKKIYYSDTSKFDYFAEQLAPKLQKAEWRKNMFFNWILEADKNQKKQPYCGLENLAATCYVNCLFQQLFMISTFRDNFLKVDSRNYRESIQNNQIFQFQKILSNLKYGNKKSYTTRPFCQSFITYQGRPIDPMVQSDADEFFNTLMEKMETFLRQKNKMHILQSNFQGTLSNQLNCEGCPHNSEKLQNFLSIGVNIKNKKTLDEALKGYTEGEILDGDNAYLCQPCNKKVKTLKRLCIKQLPNILVIVLKRFQFNYDEMRKVKLNHELRFSQQLNMKNYMASYLANQQTGPDEDYSYNLRGVVIHGGTAEGGHYYSFIKDKNKWCQFNDQNISEVNLEKIESDGFGGQDRDTDNQLKFQKHKNAYLLFYEKKNWKKYQSKEQDQTFNDILRQHVLLHNSNRNFMSFALDSFFIRFVENTLMVDNKKTAYFGLLFFHVVVLRDKNRDQNVANYYRLVQTRLQDKIISQWFLDQISPRFIKQFYIQAPKMCKYLSLGLLKKAISVVQEVSQKFIKTLIFSLNKKGMTPFAYIFYQLSLVPANKQILTKYEYPQKILTFLVDKKIEKSSVICDSSSSYFGQDSSQKDKEVQFCPHALIKSLNNFDVEYDDLMRMLLIYNGKQSIKVIVTKMITKQQKIQDLQQLLQNFLKKISENQYSKQSLEKFSLIFSISCRVKDQMQRNRIKIVIQILNDFFSKTQNMYDPVDMIIRQINSIAMIIPQFRNQWKQNLEVDANIKKTLTSWIKEVEKPHFMSKIQQWKKKINLFSFEQRREFEKNNKIRIENSVKWMFNKQNEEFMTEKQQKLEQTSAKIDVQNESDNLNNVPLGMQITIGSKTVKVKEHLGFLTKVQYQKQNKWAYIEKSEIEMYQCL